MKPTKAVLVPVDAAPKLVEYSTLEDLQALVGGYIEGVYGRYVDKMGNVSRWSAYCNEEGKLDGLALNNIATNLACHLGWSGCGEDVLCGPVVFIGGADENGDDIDVPDFVIQVAIAI